MTPRLTYRADIDGLRAVAILSVLIFHASPALLSSGFIGVDIFFVISAYLITDQIIALRGDGAFRYRSFFARRIKRLAPALVVVTVSSLLLSHLLLPTSMIAAHALEAVATLMSWANFYFFVTIDYFNSEKYSKLFLHAWSLSVEEQFYLFWPGLLCLLIANRCKVGPRAITAVLALTLIGLAAAEWMVRRAPEAAFYLPHLRVWEFGIGALVAMALRRGYEAGRLAPVGASCGAALIVLSLATLSRDTLFPGISAAPAVLGAGLLIWTGARDQSVVHRALALPPCVFIGKISYSLYLIHWPVLVLAAAATPRALSAAELLALALFSIAAAYASTRWVEQPVRRATLRDGLVLQCGLAAVAVACAGALTLREAKLGEGLDPAYAYVQAPNPLREDCHRDTAPDWRDCALGAPQTADLTPHFLLVGDSHADHWAPGVSRIAAEIGATGAQWSGSACIPFYGVSQWRGGEAEPICDGYRDALFAAIDRFEQPMVIVLAARWSLYFETDAFLRPDRPTWRLSERDSPPGAEPADTKKVFEAGLTRTLERLRARGHRVIILGQAPEHGRSIVPCEIEHATGGAGAGPRCGPESEALLARLAPVGSVLAQAARDHGAIFADPRPALCPGGQCLGSLDGVVLYRDHNHLNPRGAELTAAAMGLAGTLATSLAALETE